ncbi:MAG: hypothetical protein P4M12_06785 [Gammaproteobacteria bacterium]|nr:hypothetical protein [Gammaproteobacteria bacterium]
MVSLAIYHFNSKDASECTVFEIQTKQSKSICAYTLIDKDLREALLYYSEYERLLRDGVAKENIVLAKALFRAFFITYGKCFTKGNERGVWLNRDFVPKIYMATHDLMMEIRNTFIAHADTDILENCKYVFLIPLQERYLAGENVEAQSLTELHQVGIVEYGNDENESEYKYKEAIDDVQKKVSLKLAELKQFDHFSGIRPQGIYEFIKTPGERIVICEKELDVMKKAAGK